MMGLTPKYVRRPGAGRKSSPVNRYRIRDPRRISSRLDIFANAQHSKNVETNGARTGDGSADYFTKASHADFVIDGETSFWISAWIYVTAGGNRTILSKHGSAGGNLAWHFFWENSTAKVKFTVSNDGSNINSVLSAASAGSWHFAMVYYDADNDNISASVDGAAFETAVAHTGGVADSSAALDLGRRPTAAAYYQGSVARVAFGKPPSAIADQIEDIRDTLYGGGDSASYADVTSTQETNWGLKAFWNLNEGDAADNAVDATGNHDLTATSAPGTAAGPGLDPVTDGDTVQALVGVGNSADFAMATANQKPIFRTTTNGINNMACMQFDGSDVISAPWTGGTSDTGGFICAVIRPSSVSGNQAVVARADTGASNEYLYLGLNGVNLEIRENAAGTVNAVRGGTTLANNNNYIISVFSSGSAWRLWVNGSEESLTVVGGSNNGAWYSRINSVNNISIGAINPDTRANEFTGKVGDVISSNKPHLHNMTWVEQYLSRKYRIAL